MTTEPEPQLSASEILKRQQDVARGVIDLVDRTITAHLLHRMVANLQESHAIPFIVNGTPHYKVFYHLNGNTMETLVPLNQEPISKRARESNENHQTPETSRKS